MTGVQTCALPIWQQAGLGGFVESPSPSPKASEDKDDDDKDEDEDASSSGDEEMTVFSDLSFVIHDKKGE